MTEFLTAHWVELLLALTTFLSTYTALTETKKDDRILNIIKRILQAVVLGKNRNK